MKASRITAVGLVVAAALWILSGHLIPHEFAESKAALRVGETKTEKRFRVAVIDTNVVSHSRKLVLSGRTEADRKVVSFARTNGLLQELRVRRGSHREERRHHRHPVGRCARGPGAAGQGAARAAHDRTGCEAAAGCDQRHSAVGAQQLGSAAQGCARPRLRRPKPSATVASSPRPGTASSPKFRRSALRRSPSPARRSPRSSVSIRCLPWSRCPNARSPTSRSATSPR